MIIQNLFFRPWLVLPAHARSMKNKTQVEVLDATILRQFVRELHSKGVTSKNIENVAYTIAFILSISRIHYHEVIVDISKNFLHACVVKGRLNALVNTA